MRRAVVAAALLLAACGGREPPLEQPRHIRNQIQRTLSYEVKGKVSASFSGRHLMEFVSFVTDRPELTAATVATISTASPTPFSETRAVIIGVSLVGNYTGDGDYVIPPRGEITAPPSPGGPTPNLSVVRVEIYPWPSDRFDPPLQRIDLGVSCRLHVEKHATIGSVRCAGRSSDPERQVTLTMRWGP